MDCAHASSICFSVTLVFWLHLVPIKHFTQDLYTGKISLAKLHRQDYTGISGSQAKETLAKGYW